MGIQGRGLGHYPLNATKSSVRVLQITAEYTESLVEGGDCIRNNKWLQNQINTGKLFKFCPIKNKRCINASSKNDYFP